MEHPNGVYALISLWPSRSELADDLSTSEQTVKVDRVHKWAQNGAIPQQFMSKIVKAAEQRNLPVTAQSLLDAHISQSQPLEDGSAEKQRAEATGR